MIRGLKVFDISPGANPVHADFSVENLKDPLWINALKKPSAYLVRQSDLPVIRSSCSVVIDRKVKDSRKGLSAYLLGMKKKGIPLIDGNYEDTRQIFRSIRDLLSRARDSGEKNLYIVGIRDTFFEEMQGMAETHPARRARTAGHEQADEGLAHRGRSALFAPIPARRPEHTGTPSDLEANLLGMSPEIRFVRQMILRAAGVELPVLILGAAGTGKDLVAREIHRLSGRKGPAPVYVGCGATPGALFPSELFGHARGAWPGALRRKTGKWECAGDGTLFLDEVGELDGANQAGVLHAIQDRLITPVGGSKTVPVSARIVSSTNRNLFSLVRQGQFREDLFSLLSGLIIRTPSLRDIPGDIPLIARKIWKEIARDEKAELPDDILDELTRYPWPGNVRELKMVLGGLRALFARSDLKARHVRLVFSLQGRPVAEGAESGTELRMHRLARTIGRLKSVAETLHALNAGFAVLRASSPGEAATADQSLEFHVGDLEFLCREPSLFGEKKTFLAVHQLQGQLSYYLDSPFTGAGESSAGVHKHLGREIDRVIATVLKAMEDLLEGNSMQSIVPSGGSIV